MKLKQLLLFPIIPGAIAAQRELWFQQPATDWITGALPIGNGRLAASLFNGIQEDVLTLNVDSLWIGGPFQNRSYNGGNPEVSLVPELRRIQDEIFRNGTGDTSALLGESTNFGSYSVLGNLTVKLNLDTIDAKNTTGYRRSLDLSTAAASSQFTTQKYGEIQRTYFCSFPQQACVYYLKSSSGVLPDVTVGFNNQLRAASNIPTNISAISNTVIMRGLAENTPEAMVYDARAAVVFPGGKTRDLAMSTGELFVTSGTSGELWIVVAADTNYDINVGTAAQGYSFKGVDPADKVQGRILSVQKIPYASLLNQHIQDYEELYNQASIILPDPLSSVKKPTDQIVKEYDVNKGDPFLEGLLFDFGRYLLIASSRSNSLPPNLQGKWAIGLTNPWGADYHVNINLQMALWGAEALGLGSILDGTWEWITKTLIPRGEETAKLIYGITEGWVVFNELNIFGHTAMKGKDYPGGAKWADYNTANAWLMQHVWDHYSYTSNETWYSRIGFPLLSSAAKFHISQLLPDRYTNDNSLVVNPCNSPEQSITTFGCSIHQQQITELFNNILKGPSLSPSLESRIKTSLESLDSGVRVGRYGQIQEWKLDLDDPNDQHRHLSHLYGWYPGYIIPQNFSQAVETTLIHRGWGNWTDANSGWEKLWRSIVWAGLNNATNAYYELKFAIQENFAGNLFSLYDPKGSVFQADANWAWKAAVLEMFLRDRDWRFGEQTKRTVVLAPAVPESWFGAVVRGVRIRGGGQVGFRVDGKGRIRDFQKKGVAKGVKFVDRDGNLVA
ncbi:glycoside hydrolase family 95 protein-like protein [Pyronema omphalodes]|nr:glycoside hydrolase family 95 protein-like protein [Pyronema omphalodes]